MLLRIIQGSNAGAEYLLDESACLVGRSVEAAIRLNDAGILGQHALIEQVGSHVLIRSMDPQDPVLLNGLPVTVELVEHGDLLQLGSVIAEFMAEAESAGGSDQRRAQPPGDKGSHSIQLRLSHEQVAALLAAPSHDEEHGHRAAEQLRAIYAINQVLSSTLEPRSLLERTLEIVIGAVQARRGFSTLHGGETNWPAVAVSLEWDPQTRQFREGDTEHKSLTIIEHVLTTGEAVLTSDAGHDRRFQEGKSIHALRIESAMCAPLRGAKAIIGLLYLEAGPKTIFTKDSLKLLACIGDMAGKVLDAARLHASAQERRRLAAVGKTLASTAHHLKNLLTGLSAGAQLIDLGLEDRDFDSVAAGWKPIRSCLDGIQDLVLNMLDFSKDRRPTLQELHIEDILEPVLEICQRRAQNSHISMAVQQDPALPTFLGDSGALQRALLNLLVNALEAIPAGQQGRIVIDCRHLEQLGELAVSVTDNGGGIPPDVLPRIFDLFFSSKGGRGTGFGLPVTRKVIEEHMGRLEVQSAVGRGTTFTVYLPRHPRF